MKNTLFQNVYDLNQKVKLNNQKINNPDKR